MRFTKGLLISAALLFGALFPSPGSAQTQNSRQAGPGAINYVEGQASIGTETLRRLCGIGYRPDVEHAGRQGGGSA